jgi:hypothetical protein
MNTLNNSYESDDDFDTFLINRGWDNLPLVELVRIYEAYNYKTKED